MRRTRVALLTSLAIAATSSMTACGVEDSDPVLARPLAPEPPDPAYSAATFTWGDPDAHPQRARAVVRQPDGKLVVAASLNFPDPDTYGFGANYIDLVRLTPEGRLDTTFGGRGTGHSVLETRGFIWQITLASAPNGKLYVASIADSDTTREEAINRLDASGIIDPTWGDGGTVRLRRDATSCRLAVQSDGKVVNLAANQVERFEADGTLDPTFGVAGTSALGSSLDFSIALAIDDSGGIVVGGMHFSPDSGVVARLLANGAFDTTFGVNGVANVESSYVLVNEIGIDSAKKIVVVGRTTNGPRIARLDANGTLDSSFNGGLPIAVTAMPKHIALDASRRIVVWSEKYGAGWLENGTQTIERFGTNGVRDVSFNGTGSLSTPSPNAEVGLIDPDGRIVSVGGQLVAGSMRASVTRRNENGTLDPSFGFFGTATTELAAKTDVAVQVESTPDGKTMMLVDSEGTRSLFRVRADGTLDETFGAKGVLRGISASSFMVDDAGRTLIVEGQKNYGVVRLLRLDESGNIDHSFGTDGHAEILGPDSVALARGGEGRILVSGVGNGAAFVSRVNADGTLDTSFATNGARAIPFGVDFYENSANLLLGRAFALPGGDTALFATVRGRTNVVRLGPDGGYTSVFGKLGFARGESSVAETVAAVGQPSGAIVTLAIAERDALWILERFDSSGHVDWSFGDGGRILYPTQRSGIRPELAVDARGRLYVATVANNRRDVVVSRYSVDGLPDESWGPGGQRPVSGASLGIEDVTAMRVTSDGGLLVSGGRFTQTGAVDVVLARLSLGGL